MVGMVGVIGMRVSFFFRVSLGFLLRYLWGFFSSLGFLLGLLSRKPAGPLQFANVVRIGSLGRRPLPDGPVSPQLGGVRVPGSSVLEGQAPLGKQLTLACRSSLFRSAQLFFR